MRTKFFIGLLCLLCAAPQVFAEVFHAEKLAEMDAAILAAISSNKCPGGVLWVEHNGTAYHKACATEWAKLFGVPANRA